jgi:ADP-ribose pyrophosphatase
MRDLTETSLHSQQLLNGKLLKVYRDEVRVSDGSHSIREWIRHPGAAAVVPLFDDGSTLLVRQFRFPSRRVFLEVPAGKLDHDGESPEDVAHRELEEETGFRASRLVHLGSFYPCIGYSDELIHFYLAEGLTEGERNPSDGEVVETISLGFHRAVEMARGGEIEDMKSLAALLCADAYLSRRNGSGTASL